MERYFTVLFLTLVIVCLSLVQCQATNSYPAIAMVCGKNTQHRNVNTGDWITDSSGRKDCMSDEAEILEYCRQVYPDLQITNTAKETSVRISSWCSIGHKGPNCQGHSHLVTPFRCVSADHTPTLIAKTGCSIVTLSDETTCKGSKYWVAKAAERCRGEGKILNDQRQNVMPCDAVNKWHGIEFACCETKKPVPKLINVDPICAQPKMSGPCRAAFDMYFYDTKAGACAHFIYGGCGGNDNRFTSEQECQDRCSSNSIVVDPLLSLGPVISNEDQPQTTTTASTPTSTNDQPSDSYFNAPLDPKSEQEMYSKAQMDELKEHQNKLSSLMQQWNSAKADLLRQGASPERESEVDSNLQQEVEALKNEHERKREQLTSAHQARMDALIVGSRTSAYDKLQSELNKPDIQPSKVIMSFRLYLHAEIRDHHHTSKQLQHAIDQNSDDVDPLNARLSKIKHRVNNALSSTQQRLDPGKARDKLSELVSNVFPTTSSTPTIPSDEDFDIDNDEEERPRIIDYGGLPPENVDYREEVEPEYNDEEAVNDAYNFDEYVAPETPAPLNPADFNVPKFEDDDDLFDVSDDEFKPLRNSAPHWDEDNYNEQNWLIWVGVGGSCLLLVVVLVAVARVLATKHNSRRQFARVEVEEQLTPEERQLLQMQQNGYENPTYKFFEKQKLMQQQQEPPQEEQA